MSKYLFSIFILIMSTNLHAAMCNVGGQWYPYSDPRCSKDGDPSQQPDKNEYQLFLKSYNCKKEDGYVSVSGEVTNISPKKLENIQAIGKFRTKSGELVKVEDSFLMYNPIMPGQTSPYKAWGTDNPLIVSCDLSFKVYLGGNVSFTDKKPSSYKGKKNRYESNSPKKRGDLVTVTDKKYVDSIKFKAHKIVKKEYYDMQTPFLKGSIVNKGKFAFTKVDFRAYFYNDDGNIIKEKNFSPINKYSLNPFRPNYEEKFSYPLEHMPSDWNGKYKIEVISVGMEFSR